jgi:hypothetical protein
VAVRELGQSLELRLAVDLELALENMPRGRAAEPLVCLIDSGQQRDVRRRVVALVARPTGGLGRDPPKAKIVANEPRYLCPAEAGHVHCVGPQQPFGAPFLKRILVMAEQAFHPAVNFRAPATGEPHTLRDRKKCLFSTKLNFSAPSTLIIHLQLARSNPFRLILRWNQLPRSGSSCVGKEFGLTNIYLMAIYIYEVNYGNCTYIYATGRQSC